jgi:hypothetical protein
MGTAEIVDIARSVWKAIIIIVLAFAALNFLIQALLRWEKRFMNRILNRIEYENEFAVSYAHVNDLIYIRERVTNRNAIPLPKIRVDFSTPSSLEFPEIKTALVNTSRVVTSLYSLGSDQRVLRNRSVKCTTRGFYDIKGASVTVRGFISGALFSRAVEINAKLWVYPEFIDMRTLYQFSSSPMGDVIVRRWIMEDPFLYSGVRVYRPGDAFKKIHWGLTAKNREIMVRQNDYTSEMKLCVALNIQPSPVLYGNIVDKTIAETGIKVAATLVDQATEVNAPVSFICNSIRRGSRNAIEVIDYGKGKKHFAYIMENMAQLMINNSRTLEELVDYLYENISDSAIVIVTHYVNYNVLHSAGRLRGKGNKVQFIVLDDEYKYNDIRMNTDIVFLSMKNAV